MRSKFEESIFKSLEGKVKAEYESEKLSYTVTLSYVPDIIVYFVHRPTMYLELKGYLDYDDQRKMRAVKQANPELDIRFVFMKDNKISKTSKLTYSSWSEKYGFPFCFNTIPEEWLIDKSSSNL